MKTQDALCYCATEQKTPLLFCTMPLTAGLNNPKKNRKLNESIREVMLSHGTANSLCCYRQVKDQTKQVIRAPRPSS